MPEEVPINMKKHWEDTYLNTPENKLGWIDSDLTPMLKLIFKTKLRKTARILNVGAGSTMLIDELLKLGYSNIIASDISNLALEKLKNRIKSTKVEYIEDDLINPIKLTKIENVDLWIDRAVLHFFTKDTDKHTYLELLKSKVNHQGYVILAEFNMSGAKRCAGLPVERYSKEKLMMLLGDEFSLLESVEHTCITPSGTERPYIYTLFRKI